MSKEMIISVNGREKKIAIVDNGRGTEFYIERGEENSGVVGNIYKGRVQRVLPGMQSAFVDIGLERAAFAGYRDKHGNGVDARAERLAACLRRQREARAHAGPARVHPHRFTATPADLSP